MAAAVAEPTAQVTGQLAMIIHALQKMRTLPFPLARGFLVLKEEQRPARKMLTPFIPDSRPHGVDMEDIIGISCVSCPHSCDSGSDVLVVM